MTDDSAPPSGEVQRVVIVSCTNRKQSEPTQALAMYEQSSYYRKMREYAFERGDKWFIQSAKHGLLTPMETIEPYDKRAQDIEEPARWASEIATALAEHVDPPATVEVLGGKAYADPLTPELEARGFDVVEPMRGMRIGERQAWLNSHIEEVTA